MGALALLMGMPPKAWHVRVDSLPSDPGGGARALVIEATHPPRVRATTDGSNEFVLQAITSSATWPGRATYLVPAEQQLTWIEIGERCNSGCSCPTPDGAKIDVVSYTTTPTWKLEARSEPQETRLDPKSSIFHRVYFTASGPARLRVEVAGEPPRLSRYDGEFHVDWRPVTEDRTVTWTAIATLEGMCADAACKPPASAKMAIDKIVGERF